MNKCRGLAHKCGNFWISVAFGPKKILSRSVIIILDTRKYKRQTNGLPLSTRYAMFISYTQRYRYCITNQA